MVRLRKVHPCGGTDWQVYRLGADIGLRCLTCGRRVMLERAVLEKRIKVFVSRGDPSPNPLHRSAIRPATVDGEGATSAAGNRAIEQSGSGPPGGSTDV